MLGAVAAIGWVSTAGQPAAATNGTFLASDVCPVAYAPLHPRGPADASSDGNVSVLVGGNLVVRGSAAGAEGVVVAHGDATFARDVPGLYELGVTGVGSQVGAPAGSDVLTVGGNLAGDPGTHLDVGQGVGGDVALGGTAAPGTDLDAHGGTVYPNVSAVTAPYDPLLASLAARSQQYASMVVNGQADISETAITLTGDGVSDPQVFELDGAVLAADATGRGRSLQVTGVPQGAAVIINVLGPAVDMAIDSLLSPAGTVIDPTTDPAFADLATHLLWNVPTANAVAIGGQAQLPGSLLVGAVPSTTTLSGAGTNGRVLVAGDLVQTGSSELHAYPFLPDTDLRCSGPVAQFGSLAVDISVVDPGDVVDPDRVYSGQFTCKIDGVDVTPGDGTWQSRGAGQRVLSDVVPAGATCTVDERLQAAPQRGWRWDDPVFAPDKVKVDKRATGTVAVTNKAVAVPQAPPPSSSPTPTPSPDPEPTVTPTPTPTPDPTPTTLPEPTDRPDPPSPSAAPTVDPDGSPTPTADAGVSSDPPERGSAAGPLSTTAPFTLRGAFVWGPLLMLSLLTMVLRTRRRPRRMH